MNELNAPLHPSLNRSLYPTEPISSKGSLSVHDILVVTIILISSRALGAVIFTDDDARASNQYELILWATIYVACFLALINYPPNLKLDVTSVATLLIVALALASTLWSESPESSLKRAGALAGSWIVGLYLARTVTPRSMFGYLQVVSIIAIFASVILVALLPNLSIGQENSYTEISYGWNGSFPQKNWLGRSSALFMSIWTISLVSNQRRAFGKLCLVVTSFVLILKSESATALILGLALLATIGFVLALRADKSIALIATLITTCILIVMVAAFLRQPATFYGILGRSPTLTGRSTLWAAVDVAIQQRVWLGYGYGGFWLGEGGPQEQVWSSLWGYRPLAAHNGYKEIRLDLGVIGLALTGFVLVVGTLRSFLFSRKIGNASSLLVPVFFIFALVSNLTESYLIFHNSFTWILLIYFTVYLGSIKGHDSLALNDDRQPYFSIKKGRTR